MTVVIQRASGSVIVGIMCHTLEYRLYFVGNDLLTNAGKQCTFLHVVREIIENGWTERVIGAGRPGSELKYLLKLQSWETSFLTLKILLRKVQILRVPFSSLEDK